MPRNPRQSLPSRPGRASPVPQNPTRAPVLYDARTGWLGGGGVTQAPIREVSEARARLDAMTGGPLIVQSDKTLLLEVDHADALACRMAIAPFAELERSPEHVHTYRLTPLGLWNARAAGHDAEAVVDALLRYSRYPVPHALLVDVAETMDRYGRLQLANDPAHGLVLRGLDRAVLVEVAKSKKLAGMLGGRIDADTIAVHPSERGRLKQSLLKLGWPAEDLAGYVDGEAHEIALVEDGW